MTTSRAHTGPPDRRHIRHCVEIARREGRNFHWAFLSLPRPKYEAMCVLYAFMRRTDDLADQTDIPLAARRTQLDRWATQLSRAMDDGHTADIDPILLSIAALVREYPLEPRWLLDVIDGVRMDLEPFEITTFADLERYCYHVAGAVGLCCVSIWGHDQSPLVRTCAIDCGTAFQLTNILRDIREDASLGRCYLPTEDLARFGLTPADLLTGDQRVIELLTFEASLARAYYKKAAHLRTHLSPDGQGILGGMMRIYGGLLQKIEQDPLTVLRTRIRLGTTRKLWIALASYCWPNRPLPHWMTSPGERGT